MVAVRQPLPPTVTADLIAEAVVAAARSYGDDPIEALLRYGGRGGNSVARRCLTPAAIAVASTTGAPMGRIAELLGLSRSSKGLWHGLSAAGRLAQDAALDACRLQLARTPALPTMVSPPPARRRGAAQRADLPPQPPATRFRKSGFAQLDRAVATDRIVHPARAQVSADDRALIDAAIASGKVTRLDPGHAAGLSQLEQHLYAAPPPRPTTGWGSAEKVRKAGQAMARKCELSK